MAHRGQWSEHEARGVLNAWRKSGQSIERFAKERGLVPQRIRWWRNKLEGNGTALVRSESPLALLPVQVTETAPAKRGEPVAVYLRSGHIVKVGRGFDEEAFARVVARTTSSSATSRPARASRACTPSSRRARHAASIRLPISPTSSRACRITPSADSTSCCLGRGRALAPTRSRRLLGRLRHRYSIATWSVVDLGSENYRDPG